MKYVIWIIVGALLVSNTLAQEEEMDKRRSERIEMMAVWKLTEHLKLTEEQAEQFFPLFREHREKIEQINQEQKEMMDDLRSKVDRGDQISNKELKSIVKKLSELEKRRVDIREEFILKLEGTLNNAQRVKLIGFEHQFRKELRKQIRDFRGPKHERPERPPKRKRDF